jgi:hypothetical protein
VLVDLGKPQVKEKVLNPEKVLMWKRSLCFHS